MSSTRNGFGRALTAFLQRAHGLLPTRNDIRDRVAAHLGTDPATCSPVTRELATPDLPNLQLALDEARERSGAAPPLGLPAEVQHFWGFSLLVLMAGRLPVDLTVQAVEYVDVPVDVDRTLACAATALHLLGRATGSAWTTFGG